MTALPPVAVEASWAQLGPTGVGRHLAGLLPRLAEHVEVVALLDARRPMVELGVPSLALRAPVPLPRLAWLETAVAPWLRHHDGLFHAAAYTSPLRHQGPLVASLHDVAWATDPTDFGWAKRMAWTVCAKHTARRSLAIITGSEHSRSQIVRAMDVPVERVHLVPNGVDPGILREGEPDGATRRSRLGIERPYVMALGGAPRRNLPLAVAAWRFARRRGTTADLVVVGDERPPAEPDLHVVGRVDDATWASLLAGADALLYPTAHEGFGLPAAEAIACGTPVVCARVGALPEVLGAAAVWSPSLDLADVGSTLHALLSDPARLAAAVLAAKARADVAPTWEDAAEATMAVYEQAWADWTSR